METWNPKDSAGEVYTNGYSWAMETGNPKDYAGEVYTNGYIM
jgi:hypothetical protein